MPFKVLVLYSLMYPVITSIYRVKGAVHTGILSDARIAVEADTSTQPEEMSSKILQFHTYMSKRCII